MQFDTGNPQYSKWAKILAPLLLLVLFIAGLAGLALATGWEETIEHLSKLQFSQVLILLGLSLVNYVFRAVRWHILAHQTKAAITLRQSFLHFVGGFALTITPGRLGELIRLRWMQRVTGSRLERLAPVPLGDRAFDLAAMGLVLGGALMLINDRPYGSGAVAALAIGSAIIATRPTLLIKIVECLWSRVKRWPRIFSRLRQAARSVDGFSKFNVAAPSMVLGMIGWIAEGVALYLLITWMGAEISIAAAVVIFMFSSLAGGLTGAPGGIGGAEASMILLLSLQGIPAAVSVPATAVIRLVSLWFAIVLGIAVFPIAERDSRKAMPA